MQKKLTVSSSPHLRDAASTRSVMLDVCIALVPAGLAGIWFFGLRAAILILVSVLSAIAAEWMYQKHTHQKTTVGDCSAIVTGLLVAYNLPAGAPAWIAVIGSVIAIILIKQIFGGVGQNFMNPALAARAILFVSWMSIMARYPEATPGQWMVGMSGGAADTVASATPLLSGTASLWDLFLGNVPGVIGETSKLAILLGGAYLLLRNIIDWRVPVTFIGTVFVCYFIMGCVEGGVGAGLNMGLYQILSGGLFLGAVFMATDYATSPMTGVGKIIMGVGCGVILFVIRAFATYPEGCSFAILFMNVVTPLIDKFTMPRSFGEVKQHG